MQFSILGPVEVRDEDRVVALGGVMPRGLLSVLLLHANEAVSMERVAAALWGEDAPSGAIKTVHVYVSRLRRALGDPELLVTVPAGYRVRVRSGELDAAEFERRVAAGRRALAGGQAEEARVLLREALGLWRGPPLADVAALPFAGVEIARLEEERLAAVELRVEADLAAGRHAEVVGELEGLTREHPWSERLHGQRMLALYRSGRQADALQAYRSARAALVDELGVEPGPELRELEQAILGHDAAVQAPRPASAPVASRLPVPLTRTIGREQQLGEVIEWCRRGEARLVTLTGPGGVGKTRLSVEVAGVLEAEFEDGAWFVPMAAITEPAHVASAVAQALDVPPFGGEGAEEAVARFLAPKHALLVLDNFEHLLPAAPLVADLLTAAPRLRVLVTSREPLRLGAERRFRVPPLAVPVHGSPGDVAHSAASALFVERCRQHEPVFAVTNENARAIGDICRRLDGLPLAIELAAARTPLLGPRELERRLAQSLDALGPPTRDAPARQQTLRATVDWSHRLLSRAEGRVFARFAVFAGGACIAAAESVTGADLDVLEGLVEKNLLQRHYDEMGEGRLVMLETIREYAAERFEADEAAAEIRERHCGYYLALVEAAESAFGTAAEPEWLPRVDAEVANLRAALGWSLGDGDPALGLRIAGRLAEFWDIRAMSAEGLQWLQKALDAAGDDAPISDRARARRAQVKLFGEQGAVYDTGGLKERASEAAAAALALSRQAGDPAGIAEALLLLGDLDGAESLPQRRRYALAEEALEYARRAGDEKLIADALTTKAKALAPDEGEAELQEAIAALRKIGARRWLAMLYNSAAYSAIGAGTPERARPFLDDAEPLARELRDQMLLCAIHGNAGLAALFSGDPDTARAAFDAQLRLARELVVPWLASEGLAGFAAIASTNGDLQRAARLLGAATATGSLGDVDVTAQLERKFYAAARERYGDRRWNQDEAVGAELSFTDAIQLALRAPAIR